MKNFIETANELASHFEPRAKGIVFEKKNEVFRSLPLATVIELIEETEDTADAVKTIKKLIKYIRGFDIQIYADYLAATEHLRTGGGSDCKTINELLFPDHTEELK